MASGSGEAWQRVVYGGVPHCETPLEVPTAATALAAAEFTSLAGASDIAGVPDVHGREERRDAAAAPEDTGVEESAGGRHVRPGPVHTTTTAAAAADPATGATSAADGVPISTLSRAPSHIVAAGLDFQPVVWMNLSKIWHI